MKIWTVTVNNDKYLDSNNRPVSFGCARVFKSERVAKEKIKKLEEKRKYPVGSLRVTQKEISEKKRYSFEEMISRLNNKDSDFVNDSYNYKMIAVCKYGFLNTKYHGYHTLEERFTSKINKASIHKTFPELYAYMQINKAFVQIPADHLVKMWVTAGDYKDETEGTSKLTELVSLLEGKDMDVCFLG